MQKKQNATYVKHMNTTYLYKQNSKVCCTINTAGMKHAEWQVQLSTELVQPSHIIT